MFQDNLGKALSECETVLEFSAARHHEVGTGDKWNSRTCKAQVKSPSSRYQHFSFFTGRMPFPVAQPTMSK